MNVAVDRAALMAHFQPKASIAVAHPAQTDDGPIVWDDFGSESLPELQRLSELASRDEWWTWPEAIAWIGSRDTNNIATLRYWAREWFGRGGGDRDPTIILGAQAFMATQFCKSGRDAEAELLNAIQCGHVGTSGRLRKGAVATDLQPSIWRGGTVVWHDGETVLVDAKQKLTAWAFDVAIRRKNLVEAFQPEGPGHVVAGGNVPANRKLNHDDIIGQAASMRAAQPGISKGSAAASIVADLPRNPKTGKPRDTRHIERMIAHLWEGGLSQSPR